MYSHEDIEEFAGGGRVSPERSATIDPTGTLGIGNDGNLWLNKEDKNGTKSWKLAVRKELFRDLIFDAWNGTKISFLIDYPNFYLEFLYVYDDEKFNRLKYTIYDDRGEDHLVFELNTVSTERLQEAFETAWRRDRSTFERFVDENKYIKVKADFETLLGKIINLQKEHVLRPFIGKEEETPDEEKETGDFWLDDLIKASAEHRKAIFPTVQSERHFWSNVFELGITYNRYLERVLAYYRKNTGNRVLYDEVLELDQKQIFEVAKKDVVLWFFLLSVKDKKPEDLIGKKYYDDKKFHYTLLSINAIVPFKETDQIPQELDVIFRVTSPEGKEWEISKRIRWIEFFYLSQGLTGMTDNAEELLREENTGWAYDDRLIWKEDNPDYVAKKGDVAILKTKEFIYKFDPEKKERGFEDLVTAYTVQWETKTEQADGKYDVLLFEAYKDEKQPKFKVGDKVQIGTTGLIYTVENYNWNKGVNEYEYTIVYADDKERRRVVEFEDKLNTPTPIPEPKFKVGDKVTGLVNLDYVMTVVAVDKYTDLGYTYFVKEPNGNEVLFREGNLQRYIGDCEADPSKIVSGQVKKFYDANKSRIEKLNPLISCKIIQALVSLSEYEDCGVGSSDTLPKAKSDLLSRISKLKI